jgi:hypothetical protein
VTIGTAGTEQYLTPIARSFQGQDWDISAGKYASRLALDCIINPYLCRLDISSVDNLRAGATLFRLTTFDLPNYEYSDKDIIARFLEQAMFGPTMDTIVELYCRCQARRQPQLAICRMD